MSVYSPISLRLWICSTTDFTILTNQIVASQMYFSIIGQALPVNKYIVVYNYISACLE